MAEQGNRQGRILCLDGGGVRGISSLWILKEIMDEVARASQEDPFADGVGNIRPCDYFDIICGTSTGGLIALMLGRMEYTVDEAIAKYRELSGSVFTAKCSNPTAKYDHRILESCIKKVISECSLSLEEDALLEVDNGCKTFVVTSTLLENADKPFLMRTYQRKKSQEPSPFQGKIWEAARATSAAPTFFDSIIIDGSSYSDGGTIANNPTQYGVYDGWALWGRSGIKCLVSLGTGLEAPLVLPGSVLRRLGRRWTSFLKKILPRSLFHKLEISMFSVNCLTSSARTHNVILEGAAAFDASHVYHRLNVSSEQMAKISLDAWDKTDTMIEYAREYMSRPENVKAKEAIAKLILQSGQSESGKSWGPPNDINSGSSGAHGGFRDNPPIRDITVHLPGHGIGGLPASCALDTGSGFSSISRRLIQRWNVTTKPLPANMQIEATETNESRDKHLDFVTLIFSFKDSPKLYRHPFSVLEGGPQDILLGQDFLMLHQELLRPPSYFHKPLTRKKRKFGWIGMGCENEENDPPPFEDGPSSSLF